MFLIDIVIICLLNMNLMNFNWMEWLFMDCMMWYQCLWMIWNVKT